MIARTKGEAIQLSSGPIVLIERDARLPIVDLIVDLHTGHLDDTLGAEGEARLLARMLRAGPRGVSELAFGDQLEALGGRLSLSVGRRITRLYFSVLSRNAPALIRLVGKLLREPGFRAADFSRHKRSLISSAKAIIDDDHALATRTFYGLYYRNHPLGRPRGGSAESLSKIELESLRARHDSVYGASTITLGLAGDLEGDHLFAELERAFDDLPQNTPAHRVIRERRARRGDHLAIVHRPDRKKVHTIVGSRGLRIGEDPTLAIQLANHAFGGMFSSTLMQEVRAKRGYAYGVSSIVGQDLVRETMMLTTSPGEDVAAPCAALLGKLQRQFTERGVSGRALNRAKRSLLRGHAFDVETADRRLLPRLDVESLGLPPGPHDRYLEHLRSAKIGAVNEAVQKKLSGGDRLFVVVGNADAIRSELESALSPQSTRVLSYDSIEAELSRV